jgi:predicted transposase/invertase (TIGR01784 family)
MPNIHDLGYSVLFSNKVIFRQLLETFVKQPWVSEIDFEHIEKLNKTFISKKHRKHESDLIYKVKLKEKTAYIVILIEFQSTVQPFMAVRVLHYMMSFYLDFINQKDRPKKLPPIFPIVLYNGDDKWTAPTEIKDLIENHDLLGDFGIDFKYFKIAENEFSPEKLLKIQNIVSTIFLAETHYDIDILLNEITTLFKKEDQQAVSLLLNWFKFLCEEKRITEADFEQLNQVYYNEGEMGMLIKAIRKEKREIFKQGKIEGKIEEKLEIAKSMLFEGLPIDLIIKITQLSKEDIEQLKN